MRRNGMERLRRLKLSSKFVLAIATIEERARRDVHEARRHCGRSEHAGDGRAGIEHQRVAHRRLAWTLHDDEIGARWDGDIELRRARRLRGCVVAAGEAVAETMERDA